MIFNPSGTGYQVYEGLAGMLIVEDVVSDMLPLPGSYGRDDIPLILQDRRFEDDGSLLHFPSDFNAATDPALRKGGHFLVNGCEGPVLEVGAQIVRFRILNASNARVYNLGFSDGRTFYQVVSDGGFLSTPVPMSRLLLAPAERAEILVDLGPDQGGTLTLRSFNSENGTTFVPPPLQDTWDTTDFDLLEIQVGSATVDAVRTLPESLAPVARIPEAEAGNAGSPRPFELGVNPFQINGKRMDMAVIDERIRLGDTEIWEITNPNRQAHPFHVHGDSFQILSRNGNAPPPHELGWKDVALVRPFETVRIIKRFFDYADPVNPYMFHCHILEHEDVGMMGQFVVEESGAPQRFASVSSASFSADQALAPELIAAGFGTGFATEMAAATTVPLPTELLGISVEVIDSQGAARRAQLFFVSPGQINYLIPAATALGQATVRVTTDTGTTITGTIQIDPVAPSLYSANARGNGVAAAFSLHVAAGGERMESLLFDPATAAAVLVNLGTEGDQVFLVLFGTGIRGFQTGVTATVGGETVPVLAASPHNEFAGLDQINMGPLPRTLIGRGELTIVLTVDGRTANTVTVLIQ